MDDEFAPVEAVDVPEGQDAHAVVPAAEANVPKGQSMQGTKPLEENWPGRQVATRSSAELQRGGGLTNACRRRRRALPSS